MLPPERQRFGGDEESFMRMLIGSVALLALVAGCQKQVELADGKSAAPVPRDAPAAAPPETIAEPVEVPDDADAGDGASADAAPQAAVASNDCAVLGALARGHYGASRDDPPVRVTLDGADAGSRWVADCDWNALGVNYVLDEGPTTPPELMSMAHVSFQKPVYDGTGAKVKTSITPPDGSAPVVNVCQMYSGVAGWTMGECTPG
jgi:hypothetical protein